MQCHTLPRLVTKFLAISFNLNFNLSICDKQISQLQLFTKYLVNCQWGLWESWSDCSATCGEGQRQALRKVRVEKQYGGNSCSSESSKQESCNNGPCPGIFIDD